MTDEQFDVYVAQIITAAKSDDARDRVGILLGEFQKKCYLSGLYALIDRLRSELNGFDNRPRS